MNTKFISLLLFIFAIKLNAFSDILMSGGIRNDAVFTFYNDKNEENSRFDDVLENKLILRYEKEEWRFYGDGRLYLYYGEIRELKDEYEAKLMRSFIRYTPAIGDFTLGKTYINLGNPGIFNPFEINKQVIISDLSYDKEGMLAFEFVLPAGDLSGVKMYAGTYENETAAVNTAPGRHNACGMSAWTNALNFDSGIVGNRIREDSNIGGLYLKGDLVLGVQGAYTFHFNDEFEKPRREANFGIDYSFFDAHLIISSIFYYNQKGSKSIEDYAISPDGYFYAKYYIFSNIVFVYDEFLSSEIGSFVNLVDNSSVIYPSIKYMIAGGLNVMAAAYFFTGKNNEEFSRNTAGIISTLIRVEAKF